MILDPVGCVPGANVAGDVPAKRWVIGVLAASLGIKLALALSVGGAVYFDVMRAVSFGYGLHEGSQSIYRDFDNTKTFLGPVLWFQVYDFAGVWGLKLFNALTFGALCAVVYAIGRRFYSQRIALVSLILFAFYVGGHRNVAVGEPDDMAAALLFGVGVLVYLRTGGVARASLLMGVAFLFKFWAARSFASDSPRIC